MAINKVVYGNTTLIDLTDSNLTDSSQLPSGVSAYSRAGILLEGTAEYMPVISNPTGNMILVSDSNGYAVESDISKIDVVTNNQLIISLGTKQNTLVSGTNIKTINNNSLLGSGDISVQETLTAGTNISISNNVISATDTTYTAGDGIDITSNVISNTAPIWHGNGTDTSLVPLNADLLEGHDAQYFLDYAESIGLQFERKYLNSSPTSSFNSQTINLGVTNIKGVYIVYRIRNNESREYSQIVLDNSTCLLSGFTYTNSPYYFAGRPCSVNLTAGTVYFDPVYPMTAYGTYGSANSSYIIPVRIYVLY